MAPTCSSKRRLASVRALLPFACALGVIAPSVTHAASLTPGAPADSFEIETFAFDIAQPTDLVALDDGRVVITERLGDVLVIDTDGLVVEAGHVDVSPTHGEQGLLGVVADPNFAQNRMLYFYASAGDNAQNKHHVIKIALESNNQLASARNVIIDQGLLGPANHNGGGLQIHGGYLYISVGDTGHNATPPTNKFGTCLNNPNGKILRVGLDGTVPADNPLVGLDEVTGCASYDADFQMMEPDTRIYAWGFRNPWRFWIDPMTGLLWVGDVGEVRREEIAIGDKGDHFGWPFFEGGEEYSQPWKPANDCEGITPATECVPEVYDYPHSAGNDCVVGGLIPSGCGWSDPWTGRYFFGDHGSGRVWTIDVAGDRRGADENTVADFASTDGIASFRMGPDGALYFVEVDAGSVQRVTPTGWDPDSCAPTPMPDAGAGSGGQGGQGQGGMNAGGSAGSASGGSGMGAGGTASGGQPGASGGPGNGTGGAGASLDGGTGAGSEDDGGCGCRLGGPRRNTAGGAALFGLIVLGAVRRRRPNRV